MSALKVLTDAVAAAGVRIGEGSAAIAEVAGATVELPVPDSPLEAALASALPRFCAAWSDECGFLAHETRTLGDGLGVAAAAYRDTEWSRTARTDALLLRLLRGGASSEDRGAARPAGGS